jgi:hypothetical protein
MYAATKTASVLATFNGSDDDVTNDIVIGSTAPLILNTSEAALGNISYYFSNFDVPTLLPVTLRDGNVSSALFTISGSVVFDEDSGEEKYSYVALLYDRYDNLYDSNCSIGIYPSVIEKQ